MYSSFFFTPIVYCCKKGFRENMKAYNILVARYHTNLMICWNVIDSNKLYITVLGKCFECVLKRKIISQARKPMFYDVGVCELHFLKIYIHSHIPALLAL